MTQKLISLFSGAGGLDLGFEAAGYETAVALELDVAAAATLAENRPWRVLQGDIHDIPSSQILDAAGLRPGDAAALIGGPPCQPFSKSSYWASGDARRLDDPRSGTLGAYLRVLRDTLPRAFLLENVPGLAFRGKSEGLELILRAIEAINRRCGVDYSVTWAKLNAADYGVPQMRERVFVIGSRSGEDFRFPAPTHGAPAATDAETGPGPEQAPSGADPLLPYATAWDAIGDLRHEAESDLELRGKWADLLPSVPEGKNYLWHTERGQGLPLFGWRRRYWSFLLKLAKAKPSWTLQAQPGPAIGPFHWQNRRLSPTELSRLQTFPEDFRLPNKLSAAQRQAGNAVPSALAEVLARAMARQLLGQGELDPKPTLAPQPRAGMPEPEPAAPVAAKYLDLAGKHAAHPGTGKGYAASQRSEGPAADRRPSDEALQERLEQSVFS